MCKWAGWMRQLDAWHNLSATGCSEHLDTGLVENSTLVKWSGFQTPFEIRTKKVQMFTVCKCLLYIIEWNLHASHSWVCKIKKSKNFFSKPVARSKKTEFSDSTIGIPDVVEGGHTPGIGGLGQKWAFRMFLVVDKKGVCDSRSRFFVLVFKVGISWIGVATNGYHTEWNSGNQLSTTYSIYLNLGQTFTRYGTVHDIDAIWIRTRQKCPGFKWQQFYFILKQLHHLKKKLMPRFQIVKLCLILG